MNEVLNKLNELCSLLESKIKSVSIKDKSYVEKVANVNNRDTKLSAKANDLAAKERLLGKIEDLAVEKDKLDARHKKLRDDQASVDVRLKGIKEKEDELADKVKKAEVAKASFIVKRDMAEAEFAKLRTNELARIQALKELKGIL